jgi:hypothetical protein
MTERATLAEPWAGQALDRGVERVASAGLNRVGHATCDRSEVNARWQAEIGDPIDPLTHPVTGFHRRLDEVLHFD